MLGADIFVSVRIDRSTDYVVVRTTLKKRPSFSVIKRVGQQLKLIEPEAIVDLRGRDNRTLVFIR